MRYIRNKLTYVISHKAVTYTSALGCYCDRSRGALLVQQIQQRLLNPLWTDIFEPVRSHIAEVLDLDKDFS